MGLTLDQKSTTINGIVGAVIGVASGILSKDPYQIPNLQILLLAVGVSAILYFITQKILNLKALSTEQVKYGGKWFLAHGAYPYFLVWLVAWVAIYNL